MKKKLKKFLSGKTFGNLLFRETASISNEMYFISVDPRQIKYMSRIPENSVVLCGPSAKQGVYGGVWDLVKFPFEKHYLYRTVKSILKNDGLHSSPLLKKVEKGSLTEKEAKVLHDKMNRMLVKFKNEEYLSQYELEKLDQKITIGNNRIPLHEMVVGMDRNGELMRLIGGKHRLAIAQQVGLKSMTAVLSLVHPKAVNKLPEKRRVITGASDEDFRPFDK